MPSFPQYFRRSVISDFARYCGCNPEPPRPPLGESDSAGYCLDAPDALPAGSWQRVTTIDGKTDFSFIHMIARP